MSPKLMYFLLIGAVLIGLLGDGVEARRKILKGRKTITRTYTSDPAMPAWAWVILIAVGELLAGGIVFLILKKKILDTPITGAYSVVHSGP